MRLPNTVARRGFSTTRAQFNSPYHYPEGPRSSIPFNPLTRWFALRYWGFMGLGFGLPFGIAVWQTYKNHFADTQTICVVLAHGDIVVIRTAPQPGEELVEIVGTVDDGISAAAWSPDEELLALATTAGTFLLMTRDFDPTANVTLSPDDVKVSNHVSVGWGKKETQFKGRGAAKALR
ncbi:hypothetical protein KC352_g32527, partial [Hortaea werneckii]